MGALGQLRSRVRERWERWAEGKRQMYPGGRPNDEARAIHRRFVDGPIPRIVPVACVLEVRGRATGTTIRVPLVIVRHRGAWYLVSMLGDQAGWVRNVRAGGGDAVLVHGRRRRVHLVEVPEEERAPILRRYLFIAIGARPHMAATWRSPGRELKAIAVHHPAFRVDRAR